MGRVEMNNLKETYRSPELYVEIISEKNVMVVSGPFKEDGEWMENDFYDL